MCIELRSHNEKTYNKIIEMWKTNNKVGVCQPTGSGKSFLILKCAEDVSGENILILSPSTHIFDQFKKHAKDINGITYVSYQKLQYMTDEEIKELDPKLIVLDEFHRCGAESWGNGVQKLLSIFDNVKVLGTTATPIRSLDNGRDMSDELFDGYLACDMKLPEAIIQGILPMPKYVSALYTFDEEADNMIDKINKSKNSEDEKIELVNEINKLKHKLDKSKGIPKILSKYITKADGRYIVFCKNKEHMEDIKPVVIGWFNKYFKTSKLNYGVNTYEVYSELQDNDDTLKAFEDDGTEDMIKLLFCINMLNEGLHISNLDGIILLRPTTSPTMYYQQIGRVMDAGKKEQNLILDLVNNFSSIRTNTLKEDLEKEAKEYCGINGINGKEKEDFINKFKVTDESCDVLDLFNQIKNRLCDSWDTYYSLLCEYKNEYGNCNVPATYTKNGLSLGGWVSNVISSYNGKSRTINLNNGKIQQLIEVGFIFNGREDYIWNSFFNQLQLYKMESDNCNVPQGYILNNVKLGSWVNNLRALYKKGLLEQVKIDELKHIGFIFNPLDIGWNKNIGKIEEYYIEYGNSDIPYYYEKDDFKLGIMASNIRRAYKNNKLSNERITELLKLEFNFENICHSNYKQIICIENKIIFESISKGSKWCGLKTSTPITMCVTGKYKSAGKHPETGEPLHWMYYDEYVKLYGELKVS